MQENARSALIAGLRHRTVTAYLHTVTPCDTARWSVHTHKQAEASAVHALDFTVLLCLLMALLLLLLRQQKLRCSSSIPA